MKEKKKKKKGTQIIGRPIECEGQVQFETRRRKMPNIAYETYDAEFTPQNMQPIRTEVTRQRDDMQFKALPAIDQAQFITLTIMILR